METTKQCMRCGEVKPTTEFYKHKGMADGYLNKCKKCTRKEARDNRAEKLEYYRQYDRDRSKTESRKAQYAEKQRRKRAASKQYDKAHNATKRAIESGKIIRPDACERCGGTPVQAHHDDHYKVFDIMWLCPVCHAQRHVEIGKVMMIDD